MSYHARRHQECNYASSDVSTATPNQVTKDLLAHINPGDLNLLVLVQQTLLYRLVYPWPYTHSVRFIYCLEREKKPALLVEEKSPGGGAIQGRVSLDHYGMLTLQQKDCFKIRFVVSILSYFSKTQYFKT